ncbi:MAG: hypothetical protein GQE15_23825 [Archangiaceae bacterium]|nr:hypothetical protein [Archangiaceae bacterium]
MATVYQLQRRFTGNTAVVGAVSVPVEVADRLSVRREGTSDQEVRQLAKSIQESAMSQPGLKPVESKGERPKPAPGKKSKSAWCGTGNTV